MFGTLEVSFNFQPPSVTVDAEIFDDSDFYHQLLRELIDRKTANAKDPLEINRQYIQLQSLRKKTKKKFESRLSKGKKIR